MKKTGCKRSLVFSLFIMLVFYGYGQRCQIENDYFQAGEVLKYDLHFKWGIISKKGGVASISTQNTKYAGKDAYKITMTSQSQGSARSFFKMDDTISSIISKDLIPLAYSKDAHEQDDYTKERMTYSYDGNNIKIRSIRHKNGNFKFDKTFQANKCTYDMLSVVFYARTLDYSRMVKGSKVNVDFVTAKKKLNMVILHEGTEKLKANDGKKYNCIKLSLKISDDAFADQEEAMTVYITNDKNRMPIRIDSKLKVGNARVILSSYKGNKYPVSTSN